MKRNYSFITIAAALLFATFLFTSCDNLVSLTYDNGNLIDSESGITYIAAPVSFEPSSLAAEPFAKCSKLKTEFYQITGQPISGWIAEDYDISGAVYYAEGTELPTLTSFDADSLTICVEQTVTVGLAVISDKEDISAVVSAFADGDPVAIVQSGTSYQLKFESEKYAGIYYNLIYVEGDDGANYIYDRSTQTCVNVGKVLQKYMPRTADTGLAPKISTSSDE